MIPEYRGTLCLFLLCVSTAFPAEEVIRQTQTGKMLSKEGDVNYKPPGKTEIPAARPQPLDLGDALHTLQLGRATVRFIDYTELRLKELTLLEVQPRPQEPYTPKLRIQEGQIYVSSRGRVPQAIPIETPQVQGVPRGTEFLVAVDPQAGRTEVTMLDGQAQLQGPNDTAPVTVHTGEQGITVAGQPTQVRPILQAQNIVQWWIFYPGVLDPAELGLAAAEQAQLADSLEAYHQGDLQAALKKFPGYPAPSEQQTDASRIYLAGLLLAVGAVDRAQAQLDKADSNAPPARALQTMIRAVTTDFRNLISSNSALAASSRNMPATASEWLALSYSHQATNNLTDALESARKAVELSPAFGFGWERVGELEFSFGRTRAAREAAQQAMKFAPRNAQAYALNGFLLAAEEKTTEALRAFDQAIEIDPGLGNAWLGRGLARRRLGWFAKSKIQNPKFKIEADWLEDVQTAAILEPTRSLVRSYAGKAFSEIGNDRLARKEFAYASKLDPNDPTPWLYSALENWQDHRFNQGVDDLEKSIALNDNRALFRSRLLLDEDRAVRSAGLARIYQSAGMEDVSLREAASAATRDYANYSAHLFMANSFDALRDPARFNLRYETAWFNELLLANLLAPVGAGTFSQSISQQEYSRLFDAKKLGLTTSTDVRSDGQYREVASQFGTIGNFGYALDLDYQHNDPTGERDRPNNGLDRIEWYSQAKYQLTPSDTLFLLAKYQDYHSGDNFQYYDWRQSVRTNFSFDEFQKPIILGGFHHEWSPGVHTLLLGGHLENEQRFTDKAVPELIFSSPFPPAVVAVSPLGFDIAYHNQFDAYTAEFTQIFQQERQTLEFGGRFQTGQFETFNQLTANSSTNIFAPVSSNAVADFDRRTAYAYYTVEPIKDFFLTAGVSYDEVHAPANYRNPPISPGEQSEHLLGPKAALVYSPLDWVTLRGIYARSLGGVSLDQSFRLEPTQLAGFIQTFRSVIPESVVGSVSAPDFETRGAALDLKFPTGTYVGLQAEWLSSDLNQRVGVFSYNPGNQTGSPSTTREQFTFDEWSAGMTANQLLGQEWSIGAAYNFLSSKLTDHLLDADNPGVVSNGFTDANNTARSDLHHFAGYLLFNHPSGFFSRAEANWYAQDNTVQTYNPDFSRTKLSLPSDSFSQFNFFIGWRFPRQRGDITLGILNLAGDDYHLNPLNSYQELPHDRVFTAQLRLRF
jgi:tetratricopeptide (TPR) repeat protein